MKPSPFGKIIVPGTDLVISRLGYGAARLFAGRELPGSARIIEAALKNGICHFDTAPSYSSGESEIVLGHVLGGSADATITTKVGHYPDAPKSNFFSTTYRMVARPMLTRFPTLKAKLLRFRSSIQRPSNNIPVVVSAKQLTKDKILRCIEGSLTRLRRSSLDILLLHEPSEIIVNEELEQIMKDLVAQGVIRAYGLGYGGVIQNPLTFGSVFQSGFEHTNKSNKTESNVLKIWHGVLRSAQMSMENSATLNAKQRISRVLAEFPESAVIFSASSKEQISQILD